MKVDAAPTRSGSFDVPSELIAGELERWRIPGAEVAIVRGDEVLFAGGFGVANLATSAPVTADTVFHHGSTGKTHTCVLAAILVDEGLLEWDRPVREYLPDFRLSDPVLTERVTIRDLLAHRTGIPRHELMWLANPSWSRGELVRRLRYLEPSGDFRTEHTYSNQGYALVGHVIGVVTGSTWEEQMRARLFEPLGMSSATTSIEEALESGRLSRPHEVRDGEATEVRYRAFDAAAPAGQIMCSAIDSATWLRFLAHDGELDGRRLVSKEAFKEIRTVQFAVEVPPVVPDHPEWGPTVLGLGLGPAILTYRNRPAFYASGEIDGFRTTFLVLPEERIGVLVSVNVSGSSLPFALSFHLADLLMGHEPRAWLDTIRELEEQEAAAGEPEPTTVSGTSPSHPLDDFVAEYEHLGYGVLRVAKTSDTTLGFELGELELTAEHRHFDTWTVTYEPLDITFPTTFFTDAEGVVSEVLAGLEPTLPPIRFARRRDDDA